LARRGTFDGGLIYAKRDCAPARRFLEKAQALRGAPEKITIDRVGANTAAIERYHTEHHSDIVEKDRRIAFSGHFTKELP
jgi:transposase-like protein